MDKRLKTMGGISPEMMEAAKAAMLEENMNYSEAEAEAPSKRSGASMPSIAGFAEHYLKQRK